MKNRIYYFSATGNTLWAARCFADQLQDTELINIADLDRSDDVSFGDAETVGVFSPVYCFGLPMIVQQFASRIIPDQKAYVYFVSCCSGMKGSAPYLFEDLLKEKGIVLANEFSLTLPSNYIARAIPSDEEHQKKLFEKAREEIKKFSQVVQERKQVELLRIYPFDIFSDLVAKSAGESLKGYDKWFWVTEDCDSCGLCERVCPQSNIILMNGYPTWRGNCQQCMACIQWCPKGALQFRKVSLNRRRYHHPEIKADDIVLKICK